MADTIVAHSAPILVAIDISKARHEVLIAIPGKKRRRRLTVLNQMGDFNRLIATLSEYGRPVRLASEGKTMDLTAIIIGPWPIIMLQLVLR